MNKRTIAFFVIIVMGISSITLERANAEINNGWINGEIGWSYYENGIRKTGWIYVDNNWYYMNETGFMTMGWQKVNGDWYFLQDSGAMKIGWLNDKGKWYYLKENGDMAYNTSIDGYYLGTDGALVNEADNSGTNDNKSKYKDVIMKTEKSTYELGTKKITIYITNNSKESIYYGLQYEVEKFEDNKWVKVPFKEEQLTIEIAYNLEPGKTNSESISLENLQNLCVGKYRIVKFGGELTAEFEFK